MIIPAYVTSRLVPGTGTIYEASWYMPGAMKTALMPDGIDMRGNCNFIDRDIDIPYTIVGYLNCHGLCQVEKFSAETVSLKQRQPQQRCQSKQRRRLEEQLLRRGNKKCHHRQQPSKQVSRTGFYFDQGRCVDCKTCTVGCKVWNNISPGPGEVAQDDGVGRGHFPQRHTQRAIRSLLPLREPGLHPRSEWSDVQGAKLRSSADRPGASDKCESQRLRGKRVHTAR